MFLVRYCYTVETQAISTGTQSMFAHNVVEKAQLKTGVERNVGQHNVVEDSKTKSKIVNEMATEET